jgi:hypothetical protein
VERVTIEESILSMDDADSFYSSLYFVDMCEISHNKKLFNFIEIYFFDN